MKAVFSIKRITFEINPQPLRHRLLNQTCFTTCDVTITSTNVIALMSVECLINV